MRTFWKLRRASAGSQSVRNELVERTWGLLVQQGMLSGSIALTKHQRVRHDKIKHGNGANLYTMES
jgi:hypothetical protein